MLTKFRFYSSNMNWTKKLRLFNELGRILSGNVHQSVSQIVRRTHQKEHLVVRNPFGQFWRVSVSVFQLKLTFKNEYCARVFASLDMQQQSARNCGTIDIQTLTLNLLLPHEGVIRSEMQWSAFSEEIFVIYWDEIYTILIWRDSFWLCLFRVPFQRIQYNWNSWINSFVYHTLLTFYGKSIGRNCHSVC